MPDITFEEDKPRKVVNAYTPTVEYLIAQLEAGTPKRATIPVASEEERKSILRKCRDAANAAGYSAGERQLDDDDTRDPAKVLLVGVRVKRDRSAKGDSDAAAA